MLAHVETVGGVLSAELPAPPYNEFAAAFITADVKNAEALFNDSVEFSSWL